MLWETGNCVARATRGLYAARSSVQRWRALYEEYGEQGLRALDRGRSEWKANDEVLESLAALTDSSPRKHGYLRSRWSSELLAIELQRRTGLQIHATKVRRWLRRLGFGYRRARPTLCIRDPNKSQRLEANDDALAESAPDCEVFLRRRGRYRPQPENRPLLDGPGDAEHDSLYRARTRTITWPAY